MTEDKVKLVQEHKEEFGLNNCLSAIGLPKSTWYYWRDRKVSYEGKYGHLHQPLLDVLEDNPTYGYRRIKSDLEERGYEVGEHVVRKLLKRWDLSLRRSVTKPKPSKPRQYLRQVTGLNRVKGIEDPAPFQVLYTDFTQIEYADRRKKAYLMPIIDHKTKLVVGWGVSERKDSDLALYALSITRGNLEQIGLTLEGLFIHHDQDSVYTGYRWLQAVLIRERMKISFSENGAKGNTYMESFNGHFKRENADLFLNARNIWELRRVINERMEYYNRRRRHSALGYLAPLTYIEHEMNLPKPAVALAKIGQ
jgi:transposase InsO family protein